MAKGDVKRQLRNDIIELSRVYITFPDGRPFDDVKAHTDTIIARKSHRLHLFNLMRQKNDR